MVMDGYYIQDRLPELWTKINSVHMQYLEMEENPKKLETKNRLDDLIKEYLCIAPHPQKFFFKETSEVLHRSASNKKDFSGYRAALGWNAIAMYAGNLVAQPWRQEYRQIKMYSGFYKHQIEANLVGAEIMFEAMGYKHAGNGVMVLEGPICPDRVTNVSQDSLVAYVECQILKEIWEDVSSYNISWLEVLEFRETHLCSPKKSVEALKYQTQQRHYQEHHRSYSQGNNDYLPNNSRYLQGHMHVTSPNLPSNHSFPPLSGHSHSHLTMPGPPILPPPPPQCIYNNGYYGTTYGTYGIVPHHYSYPAPAAYAHAVLKQPHNGYCCNGYGPSVAPYTCPVPTGQLIELEPHNHTYDVPDGIGKVRRPSYSSNEIERNGYDVKIKNVRKGFEKADPNEPLENWEYVYKDLESQGYSKDLGERGDVLSTPHASGVNHTLKEGRGKSLFKNSTIDRPLKISEALDKYKQHERARPIEPVEQKTLDDMLSSSYDNLSLNEINTRRPTKSIISPKAKVDVVDVEPEPKTKFLSKTLDVRKLKSSQPKNKPVADRPKTLDKVNREVGELSPKVENTSQWHCSYCTYLNGGSKNICEMCSRSKVAVSQHMEIGGSECSHCTLVNPKDLKVCEACGHSLQDSPTYI